jgi:hypothetical protein
MSMHDQAPVISSPKKRAYQMPQVTDLGDVRDLTRGGGTPRTGDGKASKKP